MFGCSREPAEEPLGWECRQGNMRRQNLITLLSALSLARGSAGNGSENDGSGDGSPILSTVTSLPPTSSSAGDDHEPVFVTTSTTERSFETKNTPSTELNAVNDQDSLEVAEESILIYVVPLVLLVLLILLIIFFVVRHKRKKSKQDELGSENVKSPIFEEDTPSVMEIEMEELDKWMNSMNKNADCECLPTVREEEKESTANPRMKVVPKLLFRESRVPIAVIPVTEPGAPGARRRCGQARGGRKDTRSRCGQVHPGALQTPAWLRRGHGRPVANEGLSLPPLLPLNAAGGAAPPVQGLLGRRRARAGRSHGSADARSPPSPPHLLAGRGHAHVRAGKGCAPSPPRAPDVAPPRPRQAELTSCPATPPPPRGGTGRGARGPPSAAARGPARGRPLVPA
ncbi:transmembrane protein 154 [Aegotheles albertisi]